MTSQTRIIKSLAGLIAGIGAAIIIMMVSDALAHRVVPPPAGSDVYAASDPSGPATATLIAFVIGWFAASLIGGLLAIRISRVRWTPWAVAGVIILAVAYLFASVAHPLWTIAAGVAAPLTGALLATRLGDQRVAL